jgi:hypothetical protein
MLAWLYGQREVRVVFGSTHPGPVYAIPGEVIAIAHATHRWRLLAGLDKDDLTFSGVRGRGRGRIFL